MVDFAASAGLRVRLKESEKKNKSLGFTKELKKLWNIKITIGALGTIRKGLI